MLSTTLRLGLGSIVLGTIAALLGGVIGRLLPVGEQVIITLSGRPYRGAYLLDVEHRLLYTINRDATSRYAPHPLDSSRVAYTDVRDDNWDVYVTDLFTGETQRLTNGPDYDGQAAWSPDGRWIAYTAESEYESVHINALRLGGGVPRQLTDGSVLKTHPAWSPDGRLIVYEGSDEAGNISLYVTDVACLMTDGDCNRDSLQLTSAIQGDYLPAWSPDGRWIAFLSDRGGSSDVYIMDTACMDTEAGCIQQNARQLTHGVQATSALMWSRDGQKIRFIAEISNIPVFYEITMGCDLSPNGCTLQTLVTIRN